MTRNRLAVLWAVALILGASSASAFDPLQRADREARDAQRAFAAGDTLAALEGMLRAQALAPDDPRIRSGLAETLYDSGDHESALRQFEPLADPQAPLPQRRRALYNAGNAAFRQQDYERALDYYTAALLEGDSEPTPDLLHNLELAQSLMEQQQQEQESEESGEDGEPQEGEDQSDSQDQQGEEQQQEGEQPPEQDPQQEDQQAPPDSTGQQPPPPQESQEAPSDSTQAMPPPDLEQMTPEEAMRLLESLDFDEQQLRESIQRRLRGDEEENEHDW